MASPNAASTTDPGTEASKPVGSPPRPAVRWSSPAQPAQGLCHQAVRARRDEQAFLHSRGVVGTRGDPIQIERAQLRCRRARAEFADGREQARAECSRSTRLLDQPELDGEPVDALDWRLPGIGRVRRAAGYRPRGRPRPPTTHAPDGSRGADAPDADGSRRCATRRAPRRCRRRGVPACRVGARARVARWRRGARGRRGRGSRGGRRRARRGAEWARTGRSAAWLAVGREDCALAEPIPRAVPAPRPARADAWCSEHTNSRCRPGGAGIGIAGVRVVPHVGNRSEGRGGCRGEQASSGSTADASLEPSMGKNHSVQVPAPRASRSRSSSRSPG